MGSNPTPSAVQVLPMQDTADTAIYLNASSERFQDVFQGLSAAIHESFPEAESTFAHGMPGFKARVADVKKDDWRGTFDPDHLQLFLVERKAGITFHIWDPRNYYGLDEVRDELTQLGFKVMRGCLVWNRKKKYPLERMKELIGSLAG